MKLGIKGLDDAINSFFSEIKVDKGKVSIPISEVYDAGKELNQYFPDEELKAMISAIERKNFGGPIGSSIPIEAEKFEAVIVADLSEFTYLSLKDSIESMIEIPENHKLSDHVFAAGGLGYDVEDNLRIIQPKLFLNLFKEIYKNEISRAIGIIRTRIPVKNNLSANAISKVCWRSTESVARKDLVARFRVDPDKLPGAFSPIRYKVKNKTDESTKKPTQNKENKSETVDPKLERALELDQKYGHRIVDEVGEGKVFADVYQLSEHFGIMQGHYMNKIDEFNKKYPDSSNIHRKQAHEAEDLYNAIERSWGNTNFPCLANLKAAATKFKN